MVCKCDERPTDTGATVRLGGREGVDESAVHDFDRGLVVRPSSRRQTLGAPRPHDINPSCLLAPLISGQSASTKHSIAATARPGSLNADRASG